MRYRKREIQLIIYKILIPILYVAVMAIIGYLLLALVYCIPVEWMYQHMVDSTTQFAAETHPYNMADNPVDNLTDSYMLLAASHEDTESPWKAAMDICITGYEDELPPRALVSIYRDGDEPTVDTEFSYARYWHGYLIVLKPLLCLFNYGEIRYLMSALQLIMLFVTAFFIQKKMGLWYALPLIVAYIFMNPASTMTCMQYNVITILMLSFLVVVVRRLDYWITNEYVTILLFCTFGLMTSYFDLLTFPILTLGMPILTLTAYRIFRLQRNNIQFILKNSVAWAVGYCGMWALKWAYGTVILGRDLFSEAIYNAEIRTSSTAADEAITYSNVIKVNIAQVSIVSLIICALVLAAILLKKAKSKPRRGWEVLACFVLVGSYPFAWYFALKNHSYVHNWFTFRSMALTAYSILMCAVTWRGFFDQSVYRSTGQDYLYDDE